MICHEKIACLPRPMRDELNRRLSANEDGASLLAWLNASPDVQAVLARDFAGEPISKQNLHEWRHGGFLESQARQEFLEPAGALAPDDGEFAAVGCGKLIGNLVALLAVRYAALLARWNDGDHEALRVQLRVLHTFTRDLAALHRINQIAERQKKAPATSDRKGRKCSDAATTMQERYSSRARADGDKVAKSPLDPDPAPMSDFAPLAASGENVVDRHSGSPIAQYTADGSMARNAGSPVLDQDLAKSRTPEVQPMAPQPGLGSNQVRPNDNPPQSPSPNWPVPVPYRAAFGPVTAVKPGKSKNDRLATIANDPSLISAPASGSQPRTSLGLGSSMDSPLDKAVPVLIAPANAVDQFVAVNTPPPEAGLLPAALRCEIFDAIIAQK